MISVYHSTKKGKKEKDNDNQEMWLVYVMANRRTGDPIVYNIIFPSNRFSCNFHVALAMWASCGPNHTISSSYIPTCELDLYLI